jgi:serine/threonine protein kinase/tetratricopeptide (TPR) repeat protein
MLVPPLKGNRHMKCPKCESENTDTARFCSNCAASLTSADEAQPSITKTLETPREELTTGSTFAGRYQIIEELGKGGMGKVYKAVDTRINEKIALKLIKPEISSDKKTLERFGNELKLARKITHKNVGKMFDINEQEGTHYITMEYVSGQDLKGLIRQTGQLAIGTSISIAKQICEGLSEAHKVGVVHRDLKPNNIMIDREGEVRIMDFGIARSLKEKGITGAGVMIGTPEYMSPEQVEAKVVDQRSDIYSLGVILFEMLTGRLPFEADTPFAVGVKHKSEIPKDPKEYNAQVPDDLSSLVLKCLEKDKGTRYQSAEELYTALCNIEKGIPTTDRVIPKRKTLTSKEITLQFNPRKLFIPVLVACALVIAAVVLLWKPWPLKAPITGPKIKNSIAVINFLNETGDKKYDHLQKVIPSLLRTNLEDTNLFYVVTDERMRDICKQMGRENIDIIDNELGFEICRREGVEALVTGFYSKGGDIFTTAVTVYDVDTKESLESTRSSGTGEQSFFESQIDELSRKIVQGMNIDDVSLPSTQFKVTDVTTTSMEAYNYYLRGRLDFDSWYFNDARKFLEKAVELDTNFASAYLWLANTYFRLGETNAGVKALGQAKALSEKTIEREKLYIEAAYALRIEKNEEKYIDILKSMAEKYPKEKQVHFYLASYYGGPKRLVSQAIDEFNKALELDPKWGNAYDDLGLLYMRLWQLDKALECLNSYASIMPGEADPIFSLGCLYFRMGKLDEAIAKLNEVFEIKPDYSNEFVIAYLYAMKEDYFETMRWIDQFISKAPSQGRKSEGYLWRGFYHYWLGSLDQSNSDLTSAAELAEEVGNISIQLQSERLKGWIKYERGEHELSLEHITRFYNLSKSQEHQSTLNYADNNFFLGLLDLKQGRINSAKSRFDDIMSIIPKLDPGDKEFMTFRQDYLGGEISLAEKSFDQAISILMNSKPLQEPTIYNTGGIIYSIVNQKRILARAYIQNGELDKAITEYNLLTTFDPNSKSKHLAYPLDYYRVARLYEQQGNTAKAIENYEKFLTLWKDADSGLPEVADARERLAGLKK